MGIDQVAQGADQAALAGRVGAGDDVQPRIKPLRLSPSLRPGRWVIRSCSSFIARPPHGPAFFQCPGTGLPQPVGEHRIIRPFRAQWLPPGSLKPGLHLLAGTMDQLPALGILRGLARTWSRRAMRPAGSERWVSTSILSSGSVADARCSTK